MPEQDGFAIPLAPPDHVPVDESQLSRAGGGGGSSQVSDTPLSNSDFRKLLMTPRAGGKSEASTPSDPASERSTGSSADAGFGSRRGPGFTHKSSKVDVKGDATSKQDLAKAKKKHMRQFNEDEDSLIRIMKKYRDRAKERREGDPPSAPARDPENVQAGAGSGYHAVAPDLKSNLNAQERRKQVIQESKYLGGDMEHTHLVKGLDFALLQKVRSEISLKQKEEEDLETAFQQRQKEHDDIESQFTTKMGKDVYRILFREERPRVNELFAPRRMAYVIELDDDFAETDIPTTLCRSKADCPNIEATTSLSTNDMVIQKLTQVLAYLRTDHGKKKKKGKDRDLGKDLDRGIYDDIGDYVPSMKKPGEMRMMDKHRGSYFEKPSDDANDKYSRGEKDDRTMDSSSTNKRGGRDREHHGHLPEHPESGGRGEKLDSRLAAGFSPADLTLAKQREAGINPNALTKEEKEKGLGSVFKRDHSGKATSSAASGNESGIKMTDKAPDSYMECYPDEYDYYTALGGDSDDEADYSKMDLGNKKGPVRRWDFDNPDDYEDYMSRREAMPKAAFQYGVKMNDGRKTRKVGGPGADKDKAKLDREWQKISAMISKRKAGGNEGNAGYKKAKY